jgi:hypothetical protein
MYGHTRGQDLDYIGLERDSPIWTARTYMQAAALASAHVTALAENTGKFYVHPAPGPEDVNWSVLHKPWLQRQLHSVLLVGG